MGIGRRPTTALAVLAAVVLCAGCGDDDAARPADASPGWTTFRDARQGLTVRFPSTWHRARTRLTPFLADPREILSLGTFARRANGADVCAQAPVRALRAMSSRDVLLSIQERRAPDGRRLSGYPPRRRPFALGSPDRSEIVACVRQPRAWRSHWVAFSDAGRSFYLLAVIGEEAPPARVRELRRVIDGLRFSTTREARAPR